MTQVRAEEDADIHTRIESDSCDRRGVVGWYGVSGLTWAPHIPQPHLPVVVACHKLTARTSIVVW